MEVTLFRQCVYKLLSSLFLDPNEERAFRIKGLSAHLMNMLESEEIPDDYRREATPFLQRISGAVFERSLREEFVALFIADRKRFCAPYEGAYLGQIDYAVPMPILLLEREYAREGLLPPKHELPDHLAVELEFLSYLCGKEITTAIGGGETAPIVSAQRSFIARHLARWLPPFTRKVQAHTETLYKEVARFTLAFVELDLARLEDDREFSLPLSRHLEENVGEAIR